MSTTTTDADRFLASIVANPDCDTARLAYADFLAESDDENPVYVTCGNCGGNPIQRFRRVPSSTQWATQEHVVFQCDESVSSTAPMTRNVSAARIETAYICLACSGGRIRDTARVDRAELLRIQCGKTCEECGDRCGRSHGWGLIDYSRDCWECKARCTRERELIAAHPEWKAECPRCRGTRVVPTQNIDGDDDEIGCECFSGRVGELRRGFLTSVPVPSLATMMEEATVSDFTHLGPVPWQPTEYAAKLFAHPDAAFIEEIQVMDRVPFPLWGHDDYIHVWPVPDNMEPHQQAWLPRIVYDAIEDDPDDPTGLAKAYSTADFANRHLSRAVRAVWWELCAAK